MDTCFSRCSFGPFKFVALVIFLTGAGLMAPLDARDKQLDVLILGGGSAHDFQKWYGQRDVKTLKEAGVHATYTEDPSRVKPALGAIDVLLLANNKSIPDESTRESIFEFVKQGGGLVISHAATWYNWGDWPEYNRQLVSGGASGHVHTSPFTVRGAGTEHPVMKDVNDTFKITDELYRFEHDQEGPPINVLARGTHEKENETHPVIWTVNAFNGRIVCNTLGHDGRAHKQPDYRQILVNSVRWAAKPEKE